MAEYLGWKGKGERNTLEVEKQRSGQEMRVSWEIKYSHQFQKAIGQFCFPPNLPYISQELQEFDPKAYLGFLTLILKFLHP